MVGRLFAWWSLVVARGGWGLAVQLDQQTALAPAPALGHGKRAWGGPGKPKRVDRIIKHANLSPESPNPKRRLLQARESPLFPAPFWWLGSDPGQSHPPLHPPLGACMLQDSSTGAANSCLQLWRAAEPVYALRMLQEWWNVFDVAHPQLETPLLPGQRSGYVSSDFPWEQHACE